MPVMDGVEATMLIRGSGKNTSTPIAALTANSMEQDFVEYISKGMDAAMGKPVEFSKLLRLIQRLRGRTHEDLVASAHVQSTNESSIRTSSSRQDSVKLDLKLSSRPNSINQVPRPPTTPRSAKLVPKVRKY